MCTWESIAGMSHHVLLIFVADVELILSNTYLYSEKYRHLDRSLESAIHQAG